MKAIICFSGGIDSTVVLAQLLTERTKEDIIALFFDYGQKHIRERRSAERICSHYGIDLTVISIPKAFEYYSGGLLAKNKATEDYELKHRNTVFFSLALTFGTTKYPNDQVEIYCGLFGGYTDCTPEYVGVTDKWICKITNGKVRLKAPLMGLNKAEIIRQGYKLSAPIYETWSCLNGGETECGCCPSCVDKRAAIQLLGTIGGYDEDG